MDSTGPSRFHRQFSEGDGHPHGRVLDFKFVESAAHQPATPLIRQTVGEKSGHLIEAIDALPKRCIGERQRERGETDGTCVLTGEGWLYSVAVLDVYTRRVLGWAMGSILDVR